MFYSKESIAETLALIRNKTSGVIRIPMPDYKMNERWTDEFRIRDGHIKLQDDTWVTEVDVEVFLGKLEKDVLDLYDNYQESLNEIRLLKQQRYEMEYGLRVAERALKNSLAMTKELIQD
jgi:hypothetical protein